MCGARPRGPCTASRTAGRNSLCFHPDRPRQTWQPAGLPAVTAGAGAPLGSPGERRVMTAGRDSVNTNHSYWLRASTKIEVSSTRVREDGAGERSRENLLLTESSVFVTEKGTADPIFGDSCPCHEQTFFHHDGLFLTGLRNYVEPWVRRNFN